MLPPPDAEPSEMLVAVGRVLAPDLPLEEAMRRVTRLVTRAFGADMGGAYFLDAAREALAPLAGYHVPRDLMETFRQTPFPIARFAFLREARRTGEAVWTADYAGDPRFDQDFLASYRPRALLFVPTTLRGEMVGGLFLAWWTEARRFAPEELRLAAAVASQVSLTLEKADLIRRMQEQLRETEILAELAKSINAALDLEVVLQRVAEGARELTRGDQAVIALRDVATRTMRFRYWAGAAYEGYPALQIEPGKGSGGQVLATGRPFRTRHYAEDPRITKDYLESVEANRVIAQMVVPIKAEDRIDGLLYVENRSTREFTDHDEAILLRLADHAAIAIRNARLFEETDRRRRAAEGLAQVSRLLSETLAPDEVGQRIADSVRALLEAGRADLFRVVEDSGDLRVIAVSGAIAPVIPAGFVLSAWAGAAGRAVRDRRPVTTPDLLADPGIGVMPELRRGFEDSAHRAVAAVPLLIGRRVIGALAVRDRTGRRFDAEDVRLLESFADQAAIAFENARLFAALQAQAAELRAHRDRLRVLSAESAKAKEEEARRIGRELHDEAGQLLAAVHLAVHEMANDLPAARRGHAAKIQRLLDQIEEQLRRLSHELRPTILDNLGLQPALLFLAQGVTGRTGILVPVKGSTEGRLPLPVETAVYRIVQEALTNASKHSRATRVEVELRRKPQAVFCSIRDNGVGFDPERALRSADAPGLGLLGIQERLHALGGTLEIVSAPGQGTELRVSIPIEPD